MARTPMRGQASGTSLREQCCFSVLVNRMLRPWPGKIDSAFIGKRRRSRQFYPLAAFGAAAALGISIGVPGLPPPARNRRQFPVVWIDRQAPPALSTPILAIPGQAAGRRAVLPGLAEPIKIGKAPLQNARPIPRPVPCVWIGREAPPSPPTPIPAVPGQAAGRSAVLPGFAQPI